MGLVWTAAGAGTPIGRTCASAGVMAVAASAENSSRDFEGRLNGTNKLFIFKRLNPAPQALNTSLGGPPPAAPAAQFDGRLSQTNP